MKWGNRRSSNNVEDRRGGALQIGGGIGTVVVGLVIYFLTGDASVVNNALQSGPVPVQNGGGARNPGEDVEAQFVSKVLADTEDVWGELFRRTGRTYREPKLVLFTGRVQSACGVAGASSGPFYCPGDQKLYLDLAFFRDLHTKYGAAGDFAQAYVIAHEVGHHVQNQLGVLSKAAQLESRVSKTQANQISVRTELQADYYAGIWTHYAKKRGLLDPGDIEEALGAASAVGDDRIQGASQGYIVPDSFTHGSSAQRMEWFNRGVQSGDYRAGNTFAGL